MAHILLIDDEPELCDFMRLVLGHAGHAVRAAGDGEAGVRELRARPADLVVCDLLMPVHEGIETIARIRREFPAVKIVAVSGGSVNLGPGHLLQVARALGADVSLAKPFSPDALLAAVAGLMPET